MVQSLEGFFREGGPFMFVNLAFSAVALTIMVERFIALGFRLSLDAGPFMDQVQKLVMSGHLEKAVKLCGAAPGAALSRVVRAGLSRATRGDQEVARALQESVLEVKPLVERRIASLWSLAYISTLVGLVGTIVGLGGTFRALGPASPEMRPIMLTRGISEAMNSTVFGLVIAAVCIVAHLALTSRAKAMVEEIEYNALKLQNMLARHAAGEPAPVEGA